MTCTHPRVHLDSIDPWPGETYCPCYGTCEECGAELEGMALLDGADDDGRPEWAPDPLAWEVRK